MPGAGKQGLTFNAAKRGGAVLEICSGKPLLRPKLRIGWSKGEQLNEVGQLDFVGAKVGFRFQRRIRILPGVHVNLSKTGISTYIGRKGLTVNLRGDTVNTTVGLPGTGLSYSTTSKAGTSFPSLLIVLIALLALWLLLY